MQIERPELPVFDLVSGPSHQRGQLLGQQSAAHAAHSLGTYQAILPVLMGRTWTQLVDLTQPMIEAAQRFDCELVHELRGIVHGAAIPFDDVCVVAARSELLQLGHTPIGECTTIVSGHRIGQTWDWFVGQLDACLLWRTPRFVAFGEAGMPPKIGVNADGVAVTLNFLSTKLAVDPQGVPVHLLLHHVLERATSTADAVDRLLTVNAAGCAAIGLHDQHGESATVELAPHGRSARVEAASATHAANPIIQTNHCLSRSLLGMDTPGVLLENSQARLQRAIHLAGAGASLEVLLSDDDGTEHPFSLRGDHRTPVAYRLGTVAAVILDVFQKSLKVSVGNPADVGFTQELQHVENGS